MTRLRLFNVRVSEASQLHVAKIVKLLDNARGGAFQ
jgi:hypothetical protein